MARVRKAEVDPADGRFGFQEWLSALVNLGVVLLGAVAALALAWLLVADR